MSALSAASTSVTAGTIFDRTRTPLTVWFMACWLFASQKDGVSALSLKRSLEIGSYQTAWAMLHRLRSVLVRPGRERLQGAVEVDEAFVGGEELGLSGGRAKGKKVLVGVAVERLEPRGFGRCRMAPLPDASAETLRGFLTDNVREGARVITDGWPSYPPATAGLYAHERLVGSGSAETAKLLPGVHTVVSLAKRWLLGTHQGEGRRRPPRQLPQRVRVPLQPTALPQPRPGVLPRARTRRRPRPRALPRPHRQPPPRDQAAAPAARNPRTPRQPRAAAREPTLAIHHPARLRLNGYPSDSKFSQPLPRAPATTLGHAESLPLREAPFRQLVQPVDEPLQLSFEGRYLEPLCRVP